MTCLSPLLRFPPEHLPPLDAPPGCLISLLRCLSRRLEGKLQEYEDFLPCSQLHFSCLKEYIIGA